MGEMPPRMFSSTMHMSKLCVQFIFIYFFYLTLLNVYQSYTSSSTTPPPNFAHAGPGIRESPYTILGLETTANNQEIRSSYKELSRKFHPDRNPSEDAADKFNEIRTAYDILMDSNKRKIFDEQGYEGLDRFDRHGPGHENPFDPSDFFDFFKSDRRAVMKAETIAVPIYISLQDLYFGTTLNVKYNRNVMCEKVNSCVKRDDNCSGRGVRTITQSIGPGFFVKNQISDDSCVGPGKSYKGGCKECPNGLKSQVASEISVYVSPGMRNGEKIIFEGKGEESMGMENGDLIFVIQEIENPRFQRNGDNLYMNMELDLKSALVGFKTEITNLDLTKILIENEDVTYDGQVMKFNGKGMPKKYGGEGNLFITFKIKYPKKLTNEQKSLIEEAFDM